MRSQLASLQQCVPQQPAAHRLMRSADHEAPSAAVTKPPSAAEAACTGAGAELSVAIASGAGRQLLAATGRVVAAAAVATAVNEQVRLAQATGEAAPAAATQHGQQNAFDLLRRYEAQAQQAQQGGKPRWSIVNLLLAPVVPLLRGLPTPSSRGKRETAAGEEEAGTMRNGYDMLLDLLSSLTASVQVRQLLDNDARPPALPCCAVHGSLFAQHAHGTAAGSSLKSQSGAPTCFLLWMLLPRRATLATNRCASCWPPLPPLGSRATTLLAAW